MAGNALDKRTAIKYLQSAENELNTIQQQANALIEGVHQLNLGFTGEVGSKLNQLFNSTYASIDSAFSKFFDTGVGIPHLHIEMADLINTSEDSLVATPIRITIDPRSWDSGRYKALELTIFGFFNLNATQSAIDEMRAKISSLVKSFDGIVENYKHIWSLASETEFEDLANNAHSAADQVRTLAQSLEICFTSFAQKFYDEVSTQRVKSVGQATKLANSINALKSQSLFDVTAANERL